MIIIDKDSQVEDFLKEREEFDLSTVRLNMDTYERAKGLEEDLLVIHSELLSEASELAISKLMSQRMIAIFVEQDLGDDKYLSNCVLEFGKKDNSKRICMQLGNLESSLKEAMVLKSQILTINRELSETLGTVETQLLRVKKHHEESRPNRFKNLKGVKALSKYAAGDSVGGEFFDIFKSGSKIFLMMSETSSYLASSSILQIFADCKGLKKIDEAAELKLLEDIKKESIEINSTKKRKPLKVNILTAILDMNSYEVKGHVFGEFKAVSSGVDRNFSGNKRDFLSDDLSTGAFTRNLERGERLLLLSPGFVRNWEEVSPGMMIESLLSNKKIKLLDILDEVFFQLKKDARGGFLSHDASAIMLEVQKNVMLQV